MKNLTQEIIGELIHRKETIATMESCTGGLVASEITNVSGSSDVFALGLVTYQVQAKIQYGISEKTIQDHTVYSKEVAEEMAKKIAEKANATWGIGTTGMIRKT